jgi:TolB-like protein
MTESSHAVFLSYASQDAQAAQRICEALRAAGIEVWFDQSELRGGDAWDNSIRRQIKSCALFIAVISKTTHDRDEGYFRLEWKLAVDRCHLMADDRTFLLPVVIDETRDDDERVPERFRQVQWIRVPGGAVPPAFVERVRQLLLPPASRVSAPDPEEARRHTAVTSPTRRASPPSWSKRSLPLAATVITLGVVVYLAVGRPWSESRAAHGPRIVPTAASTAATLTAPPVFSPPPHSIAVLPFTNLSGDPKEEYFSDGITEELIDALSHIETLRVCARTSSFSYKGKALDVRAIARQLDVGAILEGSVRRSGKTVRIAAELINAQSGFQIWSEDYDRDLKNALALQTEIATTVAAQLRVKLLGDEAAAIEAGGTRDAQAYDAYLRGRERFDTTGATDDAGLLATLALYDRAISLDPNYAAAYAQRARVLSGLARNAADLGRPDRSRALFVQARQAADSAVRLAPSFADAHVALGWHVLLFGYFDVQSAVREVSRAMSLAPGSAYVLRTYGSLQALLGHRDVALSIIRQAVSLDPQNYDYGRDLLWVLASNHRFADVLAEAPRLRRIRPNATDLAKFVADAYIGIGQLQQAVQFCASPTTQLAEDDRHYCLARAYGALGNAAEAEGELKKLQALDGDSDALDYARVYAQWGQPQLALQWLRTAERLKSPDLVFLRTWYELDPLDGEPEFKALQRRLNLPP